MNAGEAYHAALLRSIAESRKRTEDSAAARAAGATEHWYFIVSDYCPVCGSDDTYRERMYTPRPERWEDRHEYKETYDWCEG